jgi:hypothetical protein
MKNTLNLLNNCFILHDGYQYGVCKRICSYLQLSNGQFKNEIDRIQSDPLLSRYFCKIKTQTNGGKQTMGCLKYECVSMWLSKINLKTLNNSQYENIIILINRLLDESLLLYKKETKYYDFESHLRDELFDNKYIGDVKIIDKEVVYDFGRIDLLGIDSYDNRVCIELKKYREFDDTKSQLLRYKESNNFHRIIYVAYIIGDDLKEWCKENNIETYTYKRELKIEVA